MAFSASAVEKGKTLSELNGEEKVRLNARWDLGYYLFQIQEYGPAVQEFEKIRQVLPSDASLLALIGSCYSMAGRWGEGEKALLAAKNQNPEDDDINSLLGQFYSSVGKPLEGALYMEHSLRITPEQDDLRTRLSLIYLDAGQTDHARVHLDYLLKTRGGVDFGDAELDYAYARCLLQAGKMREGLAFAQMAHLAEPRNAGYMQILGYCLLGNNRYAEAVGMLEASRGQVRSEPNLFLQLGEALFQDRRWEEAESAWLEGVDLFPNAYELLSRMVDYYIGIARPEKAWRVVHFAESHNPEAPGNLLMRARLGRKLGAYAAAGKSLARLKRQATGAMAWDAQWEEAQLDYASGKLGDCNKALDNLMAPNHHRAEAHLMKAKLALLEGDKAAAQGQVLAAKRENPYNLKVYALAREAFAGSADFPKLAVLLHDGMTLMPESGGQVNPRPVRLPGYP